MEAATGAGLTDHVRALDERINYHAARRKQGDTSFIFIRNSAKKSCPAVGVTIWRPAL